MKLTADLSPSTHARIDGQHLDGEGTHCLTIATDAETFEFQGSLEDIEDVMDNLQHDLLLLKSGRRGQKESLPMQHAESASRLRHPTNAA